MPAGYTSSQADPPKQVEEAMAEIERELDFARCPGTEQNGAALPDSNHQPLFSVAGQLASVKRCSISLAFEPRQALGIEIVTSLTSS